MGLRAPGAPRYLDDVDGLIEGAYTKQFLLDRIASLGNFLPIKAALDRLSGSDYEAWAQKLRDITLGPVIKNTDEEVAQAAQFFNEQGVQTVMQIAAGSHAPRCLKTQIMARYQGAIPAEQRWSTIASQTYFQGTTPQDVTVIEPPHRGDDPMRDFEPSLVHLLAPYFSLSTEEKQAFHRHLEQLTAHQLKAPAQLDL